MGLIRTIVALSESPLSAASRIFLALARRWLRRQGVLALYSALVEGPAILSVESLSRLLSLRAIGVDGVDSVVCNFALGFLTGVV